MVFSAGLLCSRVTESSIMVCIECLYFLSYIDSPLFMFHFIRGFVAHYSLLGEKGGKQPVSKNTSALLRTVVINGLQCRSAVL